jgi:hypothetical protein
MSLHRDKPLKSTVSVGALLRFITGTRLCPCSLSPSLTRSADRQGLVHLNGSSLTQLSHIPCVCQCEASRQQKEMVYEDVTFETLRFKIMNLCQVRGHHRSKVSFHWGKGAEGHALGSACFCILHRFCNLVFDSLSARSGPLL